MSIIEDICHFCLVMLVTSFVLHLSCKSGIYIGWCHTLGISAKSHMGQWSRCTRMGNNHNAQARNMRVTGYVSWCSSWCLLKGKVKLVECLICEAIFNFEGISTKEEQVTLIQKFTIYKGVSQQYSDNIMTDLNWRLLVRNLCPEDPILKLLFFSNLFSLMAYHVRDALGEVWSVRFMLVYHGDFI